MGNKEIVIAYMKNLEKAPYFQSNVFGQDIEPRGEYISRDTYFYKNKEAKFDGWEYGYIKFENPLFLEHKNTGADGWKKDLSDIYNGLVGKRLSNAIIKDGYDAIITIEGNEYSEIVNLKGIKISEMDFLASFNNEGISEENRRIEMEIDYYVYSNAGVNKNLSLEESIKVFKEILNKTEGYMSIGINNNKENRAIDLLVKNDAYIRISNDYMATDFKNLDAIQETIKTLANEFKLNNKDQIREFENKETYKYYSTQRPISIGTYSKKNNISFNNYDTKQFVEEINREAWGELIYSIPLTKNEMEEYEFIQSKEQEEFVNDIKFIEDNINHLKEGLETIDEDIAIEETRSIIGAMEDTIIDMKDERTKSLNNKGITFYVSECMEFPSLGEYHDKLSIEEAISIYNAIPPERMNGIKGIGVKYHIEEFEHEIGLMNYGETELNTRMLNDYSEVKNNANLQQAIIQAMMQLSKAYSLDFIDETKIKEVQTTLREEDKINSGNTDNALKSSSDNPLDEFKERIENGVKNLMNSEEFTNYCKTTGKLFWKGYSFNNMIGIFLQNPNASYVMGYEEWKKFGRVPVGAGTGLKIRAGVFAAEKYKGGFFKMVNNMLEKQFKENAEERKKNPSLKEIQYAKFELFGTNISFHGHKDTKGNMSYSVMKGNNVWLGKQDESQIRKFIDNAILGKIPVRYTLQTVFDVSDTIIPETLYVTDKSNNYSKDELLLDNNGKKQYNKRGQVLISNTKERQERFRTDLNTVIEKQDEKKMELLLDVLKSVSEKGISYENSELYKVPITVEEIADKNCGGYFSRAEKRIVINEALNITEQVSVAFHEIGHSIFHKDLGEFKTLMNETGTGDISRNIREVQAEAFACQSASIFGIDTQTSSFAYISDWSKGKEITELKESLDLVWKASKNLMASIEKELNIRGLDMELKPIAGRNAYEKEQTEKLCKEYTESVISNQTFVDAVFQNCKDIKANLTDKISIDIKTEQENIALKMQAEIFETMKNIEKFSELGSDELKEKIGKALERIELYKEQISNKENGLSREFVDRSLELADKGKATLREKYITNPIATLNGMKKDFPQIRNLDNMDFKFIASSKYISSQFGKHLGKDTQKFINGALMHLENSKAVMSKNSSFVEINTCSVWDMKDDMKNILQEGMLMHPKMANQVIKEVEQIVRKGKQESKATADYTCKLTVYTQIKDNNNNNVLGVKNTAIKLGDGNQKNLLEHMESICNRGNNNKSILENITKSINERKIPNEKYIIPQQDINKDIIAEVKEIQKKENIKEVNNNEQGIEFSLEQVDVKIQERQLSMQSEREDTNDEREVEK